MVLLGLGLGRRVQVVALLLLTPRVLAQLPLRQRQLVGGPPAGELLAVPAAPRVASMGNAGLLLRLLVAVVVGKSKLMQASVLLLVLMIVCCSGNECPQGAATLQGEADRHCWLPRTKMARRPRPPPQLLMPLLHPLQLGKCKGRLHLPLLLLLLLQHLRLSASFISPTSGPGLTWRTRTGRAPASSCKRHLPKGLIASSCSHLWPSRGLGLPLPR